VKFWQALIAAVLSGQQVTTEGDIVSAVIEDRQIAPWAYDAHVEGLPARRYVPVAAP
jgi:hypothetical protein